MPSHSFSNNVGRPPPTPAREPASTPPAVTAHLQTPLDASNHPSPELLSRQHPTETANGEPSRTLAGQAEKPRQTPDWKGCGDATPRSLQHHEPTPAPPATVWLLLLAASHRSPPARLGRFHQLMRPTIKRCVATQPREWRLSPQCQQLILHQRSSLTARSSALRCRHKWIAEKRFLGDVLLPTVRT